MTIQTWLVACGTAMALADPMTAVAQILRPDSKIVEQQEAPVLVTSYRTEYQRPTKDKQEGIRHEVEYRNRSAQKIVAIQFGLVSFDLWNEFLAKTAGLSTVALSPRGRERGGWLTPTEAGFAFHTGVVYVDRVRFESGEIWTADIDAVLTAMRAIQKDFDAATLSKK